MLGFLPYRWRVVLLHIQVRSWLSLVLTHQKKIPAFLEAPSAMAALLPTPLSCLETSTLTSATTVRYMKGVIEKNGLPAADFNWGYGQAVVGWIFWESPNFPWHAFNIGSRVRGTRETTDPSPGVRSLRFLNNSLVVGSLRWMQTARVC